MMLDLDTLDFGKGGGLVTVVAQDHDSGEVLMVAHADREALEQTLRTGEMHYRSRTRGPWHKGATSGNVQRVVQLARDCDGDAVLARVVPAGPACHTGSRSCFADEPAEPSAAGETSGVPDAIAEVARRISARALEAAAAGGSPESGGSYTRRLLSDRNLRLKKLGEEATELAVACADGDRARAAEETADLLYHALVALTAIGGSLEDVQRVLAARAHAGG